MVHPAPGAPDGTLVNALLHHCGGTLSGIGGRLRPGIVHRIDKDTSGLLVVAKSDIAHRGLARQFAAHDIERRYLAVTHGVPDPAEPRLAHLAGISWEPGGVLRIEGNIGRHPGDRKRMAVLSETRQAGGDAGARPRAVRERRRRWSNAGSRPDARTRSGCTWPSPGIRWSATRVYGRPAGGGHARRLPAPGAARGEPRLHPPGQRRARCASSRPCRRTCRRCSPDCAPVCAIVTKRRCATNCSHPITSVRNACGAAGSAGEDAIGLRQVARAIARAGAFALHAGNPPVPDAGAGGGVHARQGLGRPRRQGGGAPARHQPPAPRRQDRHGLSRLRPAHRRGDLRGERRSDAGGEAVRPRERASASPPTPCGGSAPRSRSTSCARGAW